MRNLKHFILYNVFKFKTQHAVQYEEHMILPVRKCYLSCLKVEETTPSICIVILFGTLPLAQGDVSG